MLIVHRCGTCNQPDVWATSGTTAGPTRAGLPTPVNARRRCHAAPWGPPTGMREWHSADNTEITKLREPGTAMPWYTAGSTRDCDACKAYYAEHTGTREDHPK
jgi:hypothetical protein